MTQAASACAPDKRVRSDEDYLDTTGKFAAFESLSYQISHELRTPLNAVIGFSELMRNELFGPIGNTRYREYLEHISDSAQRMIQAADETLKITARLADPKPVGEARPLNLAAAINQAASDAAALQSVPPVVIEACSTIEIWGDDEPIVSAFANVLRAAALTAPGANHITVTAGRVNYDTVVLSFRTGMSSLDDTPRKPRKKAVAESEVLAALAASMLSMQGAHAEPETRSAGSFTMTVEFELSAQQVLAL